MSVQEEDYYCLCTVLSDILLQHRINLSQEEIASNLTPAKNGFIINDNKIKDFLGKNGLEYSFYWWNETPFNEPYSILKEISDNDGFVGLEDHAYRILKFEDPVITTIDPAIGLPKDFDYYYMMNQLGNLDGGFGLIRKLK